MYCKINRLYDYGIKIVSHSSRIFSQNILIHNSLSLLVHVQGDARVLSVFMSGSQANTSTKPVSHTVLTQNSTYQPWRTCTGGVEWKPWIIDSTSLMLELWHLPPDTFYTLHLTPWAHACKGFTVTFCPRVHALKAVGVQCIVTVFLLFLLFPCSFSISLLTVNTNRLQANELPRVLPLVLSARPSRKFEWNRLQHLNIL